MELLFLALFAASLIACVVTGASVVFALIFGVHSVLFLWTDPWKKCKRDASFFPGTGIFTVKNVLLTLLLISMLTAIWRPVVPLPISYIMHLPSVLLP